MVMGTPCCGEGVKDIFFHSCLPIRDRESLKFCENEKESAVLMNERNLEIAIVRASEMRHANERN